MLIYGLKGGRSCQFVSALVVNRQGVLILRKVNCIKKATLANGFLLLLPLLTDSRTAAIYLLNSKSKALPLLVSKRLDN